jgi:hypothetical protein
MDTLGITGCGYTAPIASHAGYSATLTSTTDSGGFFMETAEMIRSVAIQSAMAEAKLAQSLLHELKGHIGLVDVRTYLDSIDNVLSATGDVTDLAQMTLFARGLQAARSRLVEETSSLHVWLKVAQALDPSAESHVVPGRFVVREEVALDDDALIGSYVRSASTKLLVDRFFGEYVDSSQSRS